MMSVFRQLLMSQSGGQPYTIVQYLRCVNGAQYVDTGYRLASENEILEINFRTSNINATAVLAGSQDRVAGASIGDYSGTTNAIGWVRYGSNRLFCRCGTAISPEFSGGSADWIRNNVWNHLTAVRTPLRSTLTVEHLAETIYFANAGSIIISRNLYLFCDNNSNGRNYVNSANIDVSFFRITDDGTLKRDFIPVLWNAGAPYVDGNTGATVTPETAKPGMFDQVSKRLFVNQGTGADFLYS